MVDPSDLNVESEADYHRFAKIAELVELQFMEDYTLARDAVMVCEGLSDWEVEFVDTVMRRLKAEQASGCKIGLSDAQRERLNRILTRLGK